MPRKQFVADLKKAQGDAKPPGIRNIRAGDDDGTFVFEFAAPAFDGAPAIIVDINASVLPDVSEYPKSHLYMVYGGDNAPPHIGQALGDMQSYTEGKSVFEVIDLVASRLSTLAPDSDGDCHMQNSQLDEDEDEEFDEDGDDDDDDIYGDDDDAFSFDTPVARADESYSVSNTYVEKTTKADKAFRNRLRSDLKVAKEGGFKVGFLGHLLEGHSAFVTVSIRMSKLGLSEEAMQAWKVDPSEYLILLVHYPNGYKTNEELQKLDSLPLKPNIGMRVLAGKRYKPTLQEAIRVFSKAHVGRAPNAKDIFEGSSIHDTFISKPLATLFEENLVPVLRNRSDGMDWSGAEGWLSELQQASTSFIPNAVPDKYYEEEVVHKVYPSIMHADHYRQRGIFQYSFPLLAMQFTLRHFVRCTEFCLVCHAQLDGELQAIRPYVCDRPLCLFQYMSLGFGPSIEHDILSQPYVVDLLISFCYTSARARKLKDFPDGLALVVPPLTGDEPYPRDSRYGDWDPRASTMKASAAPAELHKVLPEIKPFEVGFDRARRELIFFDKPKGGCPVSRGQWIVINWTDRSLSAEHEELHCRVSETNFYPTISIDEPVVVPLAQTVDLMADANPPETPASPSTTTSARPATPVLTPKWESANFSPYCQDFEELSHGRKCQAICKLLDTMPSVDEMRKYLATHHPTDLKKWVERLSPATTSLLRWIIASNRACIMQVESQDDGHKEERLHGMEGYMQFRFAMGAPDKETRFLSEVRSTAERLDLKYPTIFAWHGSPLQNWHMIIREGLHFKNTDHGRAYGHGVYHAKDAGTSHSYSRMGPEMSPWPKSLLRISDALALNEIVNAPGEFVSQSPYYVVSQLDWIQTRYLFVKCSPVDQSIKPGKESAPKHAHKQDPHHTPKGSGGTPIAIPASAIRSGRPGKETVGKPSGSSEKRRSGSWLGAVSKKLKGKQGGSVDTAIDLDGEDDDGVSVMTDVEDLEILFPEGEHESKFAAANKAADEPTTDFVAGTLDFSTLPMMPMPTYAISATTKRLLAELRALAKVQSSTSPATLGWSIDTEKIENVYQWIVELHSFHTFTVKGKQLPLVADMTKAGAKSVVLEIRFSNDYPFSPPYIRVIRPRFLPFTMGGGGHVVIGGAMCMELLTNTGWSGIMSMESVLMQVRMAIASEPFARLDGKGSSRAVVQYDYGAAEAADGYLRACASHGWAVPPGFKEVAYGMNNAGEGSATAGAPY